MVLSNEKVKFYISGEEMQSLNLSFGVDGIDSDAYEYNEMLVLAATLDDYLEPEPGDIVWAKLTGLCFTASLFPLFPSFSHSFVTRKKCPCKKNEMTCGFSNKER